MYKNIKSIVKLLIPPKLLFKSEPVLRFLLYQFYRGKTYKCNICSRQVRKFLEPENNSDKICPRCGSLSRTRRLYSLLQSEFLKGNQEILDFSPSRSLYRVLKKDPRASYSGTDLSGNFLADHAYDITRIDTEANRFDVIICYHILEHIENDLSAMKELYRVTKKEGVCLIQTPFKEGAIYEDYSLKTGEERLKHFGQEDHVRIYSVEGLKDRLSSCGFTVEVRNFEEKTNNLHGFKPNETVLVCRKL